MEANASFEEDEVVNYAHAHVLFGNTFHCRSDGEVSPRHLTQTLIENPGVCACGGLSRTENGTCAHRLAFSITDSSKKTRK